MKYLLYLVFILLSFGQLQRVSFAGGQINIYLHEIVMGLVVLTGIRGIKEIGRTGKIIFIFLGLLLISYINNFWKFSLVENLVGFFYFARLALYFGFFIVILVQGNRKDIIRAIGIFGWLVIIFSFFQYFLYPDLRNLYYLGWDPHLYRVFGPFFDPTVAGIIFVILAFGPHSVPRNDGDFVRGKEIEMLKLVKSFALVILILLTYSRITYFVFIVGAIYYFKNIISYKKIVFAIGAFLLLILILPRPSGQGVRLERTFSIESRIVDMRQGIELWKKNPLIGVGYNRIRFFKNTSPDSHAASAFSSSVVTLLAAAGLIGLIAGIGVIVGMWKSTDKLGKTLIIVVSAASFLDNIFLNNFVLLLILSLLAGLSLPSHKSQ